MFVCAESKRIRSALEVAEHLRNLFSTTSWLTKHANKNAHRFDGYLVITDGEAPKPAHSRLRRGWVIVPERELIFTPDRRDFVIKVKRKKENA